MGMGLSTQLHFLLVFHIANKHRIGISGSTTDRQPIIGENFHHLHNSLNLHAFSINRQNILMFVWDKMFSDTSNNSTGKKVFYSNSELTTLWGYTINYYYWVTSFADCILFSTKCKIPWSANDKRTQNYNTMRCSVH